MAVDVTDDALADAVPFSHFPLREPLIKKRPNRSDFVICQLRIAVFLAYCHSSLLHRVVEIIFCGSYEKMLWVATRTKVALVTNIKSVWYWAVSQFVRDAVRRSQSSIVKTEHAIDIFINPLPRPAFVWFSDFHFEPEALFQCETSNSTPACFRAKSSGALVGFFRPFWHG
jgi:hypothetical protein